MKSIQEIHAAIKTHYAGGASGSVAEVVSAVTNAPLAIQPLNGGLPITPLNESNPQRGRMTDWFENRLIDFIFRGQALTLPANLFVALYSTAIMDNGSAIELSGPGYARAIIPRSLLAWAGTQGAASTDPSSGSSGMTSNNVPIQFPIASGEWGTALWWAILDAAVAGNMLFYGELLYPRTIFPGDTPVTYAPGNMTIQIDI